MTTKKTTKKPAGRADVRSNRLLAVWYVEQFCWNHNRTKSDRVTLLVEAESCAEAARLAGDNDGVHEIQLIEWLGPIVARPLKTVDDPR